MTTKQTNCDSAKYNPKSDLQWLSYLSAVSTLNHLHNEIAGGGLTFLNHLKLKGLVAKAN